MKKKYYPLNESNVLDVYKKLLNKEEVSPEETAEVKKRFFEILEGNITN